MTTHVRTRVLLLAGLALFSCSIQAATVYDESTSGDLSNSGLSPTPIAAKLSDPRTISRASEPTRAGNGVPNTARPSRNNATVSSAKTRRRL